MRHHLQINIQQLREFPCAVLILSIITVHSHAADSDVRDAVLAKYRDPRLRKELTTTNIQMKATEPWFPGWRGSIQDTVNDSLSRQREAFDFDSNNFRKRLSLRNRAKPGQIILLKWKSKTGKKDFEKLVVYAGEEAFPDNPTKYSFFIFPRKSGLEYNTIPMRRHSDLPGKSSKNNSLFSTRDAQRKRTWYQAGSIKKNAKKNFISSGRAQIKIYTVSSPEKKSDYPDRVLYGQRTVKSSSNPNLAIVFEPIELKHYDVEANTPREREAILSRSRSLIQTILDRTYSPPVKLDKDFNEHGALASSSLRYASESFTVNQQATRITKFTGTVKLTIVMPRWNGGTKAEQRAWRRKYDSLLDHEQEHMTTSLYGWNRWLRRAHVIEPERRFDKKVDSIRYLGLEKSVSEMRGMIKSAQDKLDVATTAGTGQISEEKMKSIRKSYIK